MTRIIRVFPVQTSYSPTDEYCYFDVPGLFIPDHDEVHISCTFTWDKPRAGFLKEQWQLATDKPVKLGGVAYESPVDGDFIPGKYVKPGITFTSRGCPNNCSFCFVPRIEGDLRELPIVPGNVIQDNNFLACSRKHQQKVFDMLHSQKAVNFRGGLEIRKLTDWFIDQARGLKVHELWFACDTRAAVKGFTDRAKKLTDAGFNQNQLRCYVLIGKDMEEELDRLRLVYNAGFLPFAQLYQPPEGKKYSKEWQKLQRQWQRPAIMRSIMKEQCKANRPER